jgi:hypothetical protein
VTATTVQGGRKASIDRYANRDFALDFYSDDNHMSKLDEN